MFAGYIVLDGPGLLKASQRWERRHMEHVCLSALILFLAASGPAAAEAPERWLPQADITRSLTGKTIEGHYGNGRSFTEGYLDDGRIEYSEGGPTIGGHWSVTAGTLCTIYDTDPTGGCFRVAREGDNCFEFYFAARTEQLAPGPKGSKPSWTARGSIRGEAGTCHDGANV